MPKGNTTYAMGGQRRTIMCLCGHGIVGHPTQLRIKIRLHQKVCNRISDEAARAASGSFNGVLADSNGWKGQGNDGKAANTISDIFSGGEYVGQMEKKMAMEALERK